MHNRRLKTVKSCKLSEITIHVENLSKKYRIGVAGGPAYHRLSEALTGVPRMAWNKIRRTSSLRSPRSASGASVGHKEFDGLQSPVSGLPPTNEFWALKDINFEINQGEVVGIIGRNGAGKSTLLKILSRITEPTSGRFGICGRVASLLEVGTGFHPELTGRENIYISGITLGMTRAGVRKRFDEIVEFSGVSPFLETHVKHYSSGMYMRLAFSVAAHLDPEILIVDEVLAVGDAEFQKKCLGKMEEVAKQGRTVLFVSHNMVAIEQLCSRVLLLNSGTLLHDQQDPRLVIHRYLGGGEESGSGCWLQSENPGIKPHRCIEITKFWVGDESGNRLKMPVDRTIPTWVYINALVHDPDPALNVGYALMTDTGELLYWSLTTDDRFEAWPKLTAGPNRLRSSLPVAQLNAGNFRVELISSLHFREWIYEPGVNSPSITISSQGRFSESPYWMVRRPGLLAPLIAWEKY